MPHFILTHGVGKPKDQLGAGFSVDDIPGLSLPKLSTLMLRGIEVIRMYLYGQPLLRVEELG
jgi:hypothetical protein